MNISGPAAVAKPEMLFYAPGDLTVTNDRNYCTEEDIKAFDELPYDNKVCFTHIRYPQYKSTYYISGSEKDDYLKSVMDYVHQWWIKRYYDQFDFVTWLNNGGSEWTQSL